MEIDIEKRLEMVPNAKFEFRYLEIDDETTLTRMSTRVVTNLAPALFAPPQESPPIERGNPDRSRG